MSEHISLAQRLSLEMHRSIVERASREHSLMQLFWECTLRCNLRCRHCGSDCKVQETRPDMPFADFEKVLDSILAHTDPHKVMVIITGGEPLVRADLEACGRTIYEKGFPWGVVTNGLLLTEERFLSLRRAGLHSITVSLDGLEEEHDWMRGHRGSWKKAVEAIRMIAASELVNDVVTCVNARNIGQLERIKELLISLGVKAWRIFTVFPQGRAKNDPDMRLTGAQIRQVMEFVKATRKEGRIRCNFACEGYLGPYEGEVRDGYFACIAGITIASVLADGSIASCASIRSDYHQGNIYQDDFWTVWNERYEKFRNRGWMRNGVCADCRHFRYCRGNGMHLRDGDGQIIQCLLKKMEGAD
ncbi:MAG: TIGR04133 family radical SAM/SPASM protein [Bacteroidales bacterium]|nr:TIGR04133 family radical SAM/SPASM protein [Bacteroidales bacterium]